VPHDFQRDIERFLFREYSEQGQRNFYAYWAELMGYENAPRQLNGGADEAPTVARKSGGAARSKSRAGAQAASAKG
jgi:hypothetical protein